MSERPLTSATRLFAVLGAPVAHSLSPDLQNAGFRAADLDAVYLALHCAAEELPGLLRGLARAGGGGNVTLPHKELAAATVDRATDAVRATGACNTFWLHGGEVWGDNTDVVGVAGAVEAILGGAPEGARALLMGAGGAARAALHALLVAGAGEVVVLNRTVSKAHDLVRNLRPPEGRVRVAKDAHEALSGRYDLAVNATSLGLHADDPLPFPESFEPAAALDLVYAPGATPWVRMLRSRSIPAADGREMLLLQGAAAFERWWGFPAPLEAMRSGLPQD